MRYITPAFQKGLLESADAHLIVIPGKHAQPLGPAPRVAECWAALRRLDAAVV
jgi:hypothetical protein